MRLHATHADYPTSKPAEERLIRGRRGTHRFWLLRKTDASTSLRILHQAICSGFSGAAYSRRGRTGSPVCAGRLSHHAWSGRWRAHARWPRCDRGCIAYHLQVIDRPRPSRAQPRQDLRQVHTMLRARFSCSLLFPAINSRAPVLVRIFDSSRTVLVCRQVQVIFVPRFEKASVYSITSTHVTPFRHASKQAWRKDWRQAPLLRS